MSQRYDWSNLVRAMKKKLHMSQCDIGGSLKLSSAEISHILNGKRNPGHRVKRELLEMATDNGMDITMYESHSIGDAIIGDIEDNKDSILAEIIKLYSRMSASNRKKLMRHMERER